MKCSNYSLYPWRPALLEIKAIIKKERINLLSKQKNFNTNKWTQARFNSFIKSGLRTLSFKWPPKYEVRKEAWVKRGVYKCNGYKRKTHNVRLTTGGKNNVFVDHIIPIIDPKIGFVSWDEIIKRMFCEKNNLQILCRNCHERKTNDERTIARTANKR